MTVNLTLEIDGISQARLVASKLFGLNNFVSVSEIRNEFCESTETLSTVQLKVKSLENQKRKFTDLAKREKARQQLAKTKSKFREVNRA